VCDFFATVRPQRHSAHTEPLVASGSGGAKTTPESARGSQSMHSPSGSIRTSKYRKNPCNPSKPKSHGQGSQNETDASKIQSPMRKVTREARPTVSMPPTMMCSSTLAERSTSAASAMNSGIRLPWEPLSTRQRSGSNSSTHTGITGCVMNCPRPGNSTKGKRTLGGRNKRCPRRVFGHSQDAAAGA
jgi:hypothetical protein